MCRVGTQTAPDPGPFSPSLISHGPNLHTTGECFFLPVTKTLPLQKNGARARSSFQPSLKSLSTTLDPSLRPGT